MPRDAPADVTATAVSPARPRLDAVDAVRGLVMVLMALDHVRDIVQTEPYRATDLAWTTPALFASRLVTHLCAPIFILLAGTGIYLAQRRKTPGEIAWFLVSVPYWNWYSFPLDFTIAAWLDWGIGMALASVAMAWWLGRRRT